MPVGHYGPRRKRYEPTPISDDEIEAIRSDLARESGRRKKDLELAGGAVASPSDSRPVLAAPSRGGTDRDK